MKLHYNLGNGQFTVRNHKRTIEAATAKRITLPSIWRMPLGDIVTLAPMVHVIVTRGKMLKAKQLRQRPHVPVVVAKYPLWHLLVARIKEVI